MSRAQALALATCHLPREVVFNSSLSCNEAYTTVDWLEPGFRIAGRGVLATALLAQTCSSLPKIVQYGVPEFWKDLGTLLAVQAAHRHSPKPLSASR